MRRLAAVTFLALGLTAGAGGGYWYAQPTPAAVAPPAATNIAAAADRMVLITAIRVARPIGRLRRRKTNRAAIICSFSRTRSRPSDRAVRSKRPHE